MALPALNGQITVLDHHLPMITLVNAGNIAYYTPQNQWQEIAFSGGIAEIRPGSELVLLAQ